MLYYIASPAYEALIAEAAQEAGQVVVGSSCEEDFYLEELAEARFSSFKTLELLVVDIDGVRDEEKDILTDAAKIFVMKGEDVEIVRGESFNIKITYPYDIKVAETILKGDIE